MIFSWNLYTVCPPSWLLYLHTKQLTDNQLCFCSFYTQLVFSLHKEVAPAILLSLGNVKTFGQLLWTLKVGKHFFYSKLEAICTYSKLYEITLVGSFLFPRQQYSIVKNPFPACWLIEGQRNICIQTNYQVIWDPVDIGSKIV